VRPSDPNRGAREAVKKKAIFRYRLAPFPPQDEVVKVGNMVAMVAEDVEAHTLAGCGHFMTEERPQFVIDQILKLSARVPGRS
jgi:pimeloyl-ACP methyl ester carboxylesterase